MNAPTSGWITGAGLGLRRDFAAELLQSPAQHADFLEIAPENWLGFGGRYQRQLEALAERYDFVLHGLSLSVGGPDPLDTAFIRQVRDFKQRYGIKAYSEHLSYCSSQGHLYDLLPLPMSEASARYVAERIQQVQDILGERLIIENVSAYAQPGKQMEEADFIADVVQRADCDLLLDVNNVYVNCFNHGGDSRQFIAAMPAQRIRYLHVAGHFHESDERLIDTHGTDVCKDVWDLLGFTYQCHGVIPTLLERDFNIPALSVLEQELAIIRDLQQGTQPEVSYG